MYIPVTFFGSQESCIVVSGSITSGTGSITTGSFFSGSEQWNYMQFINTVDPEVSMTPLTASFHILSGSTNQAKILIVGAGGGGGATDCYKNGDCGQFCGGGGGAGGVVYYDKFPIYSGSYELYIGAGGQPSDNLGGYIVDQDHTLQKSASVGQDSVFINKQNIYTPFTSSMLTAYGGGAGGQYFTVWNGGPGTQIRQDLISADPGGSGGGAARGFSTAINVGGGTSTGIDLGGLNSADQGNLGGSCLDGTSTWSNNGAAGGGGADGKGVDAVSTGGPNSEYASAGGPGVRYNITGTSQYYSAGGAGLTNIGGTFYSGSTSLGWAGYGSGGRGGAIGWFGNPNSYYDSLPGINGTIVIAWKTCPPSMPICKLTSVSSGYNAPVNGATISGSIVSTTSCGTTSSLDLRIRKDDTIVTCILSSSLISTQNNGSASVSVCEDCSNYGSYSTGLAPYTNGTLGTCYVYRFTNNSTSSTTATYYPCGQTASLTITIPPTGSYDISCHEVSQSIISGTISPAKYYSWPTSYCGNPIPSASAAIFPNVDYLLVAGGGGGGSAQLTNTNCGGGGGGGGFLMGIQNVSTGTSYPVVIGSGGRGGISAGQQPTNGSNSSVFGLTAIGGGAGGTGFNTLVNGASGGSGGGGAVDTFNGTIGTGGSRTASQGFNGGSVLSVSPAPQTYAAGGGGANGTGLVSDIQTTTQFWTGNGGSGKYWYDGLAYAGGGGGGSAANGFIRFGGSGVGGNGAYSIFTAATPGLVNRGSGGGGGQGQLPQSGASGSAGIVKIRYSGSVALATGGTITSGSGIITHTFTGSGNFVTL